MRLDATAGIQEAGCVQRKVRVGVHLRPRSVRKRTWYGGWGRHCPGCHHVGAWERAMERWASLHPWWHLGGNILLENFAAWGTAEAAWGSRGADRRSGRAELGKAPGPSW